MGGFRGAGAGPWRTGPGGNPETVTLPRLLPALLAALMLAGGVAAKPVEKPRKPPRDGQAAAAEPTPASPTPAAPPADAAASVAPPAAPLASPPDAAPAAPPGAAPPQAVTGPIPPPVDSLAGLGILPLPPPPAAPGRGAPQRPGFPTQPATDPVPGQLAGLAAWVGCAPTCPGAAARAGMRLRSAFVLAYPPLRAALEPMLGRRALADLARIAETGPAVERRGDWLRIALCRQDACATAFMVLFVHPAAGQVALCWHEERWEPQRLRWSENRGGVWRTGAPGPAPLPPEGCNNRGPLDGHDWDLLRRLADG